MTSRCRALYALSLSPAVLFAHSASAGDSVLERTASPAQVEIIDREVGYPRPADVPANTALVFDVELIDVVAQSAPPDQ